MNYFKNGNDKIFAFDDAQVKQGYSENYIAITEAEKDELLIPKGDDLVSHNYNKAKITLATALSEDIESGGNTWQVRNSIDLQNIQDAIDEHNYAGLEADVTQSFRMADNNWQDLTVDKFEKVLSDYRLRKKDIYNQYKTWTDGDMLEEFKV